MSVVEVYDDSSLVSVHDQCAAIESWAEQCESVPELRDAINKCAAIDEYLSRSSTEGRNRVAAAMRRIEVRIGVLLPNHRGVHRDEHLGIHKSTESEFRRMAEHPEVVEAVIAESTDSAPASRRKVMERIAEAKEKHPVPTPFKAKASIAARKAKAAEMAAEGFTSRQIADAIGVNADTLNDYKRSEGFDVPADAVVGKTQRIDSNRIAAETVNALDGLAMGVGLVAFDDLDVSQVEAWVVSLGNSLRSLNRFHKQLKETTR